MSLFSETLRMLREKNNMTREELAHELSVSATHIERLETDYTEPDDELLEKIGALFLVSADYLQGKPLQAVVIGEPGSAYRGDKYLSVPVVSMSSANKMVVRESEIIDNIVLPLPSEKGCDFIGVLVDGDNIDCPRIVSGDIAVVMITTQLADNDIVAVSFMDRPVFFRRYSRIGPTVILRSDKGNEPITYDVGDEYYRIIGKVIGFQGKL